MSRMTATLVASLRDDISGPALKARRNLTALQRAERDVALARRGDRMSRVDVAEERLLAVKNREREKLVAHYTALGKKTGIATAGLLYAGGRAFSKFADVERQLSRTGLKLGATRDQMMALQGDMERAATKFALPIEDIMQTVDAYAETGAELSDIRSDLEALAKVQQALGAGGSEVVSTWDAARKSLGLTTKELEGFFDRIAAGGAAGKFEGADLARHLPSLLPIAARHGMQGLEAINQTVGALETMADFVGKPEEAATALADFMEKISSPDVERNFLKFDINLPRALKKAREEGEPLFVAMERLIRQATGGDGLKLGHLFGDKEARRFADLLMQKFDLLQEKIEIIRSTSSGMIDANNARVLEDAHASIDRLSVSWDKFITRAGAAASKIAVPMLDSGSKVMDWWMALEQGRKKLSDSGRDEGEYLQHFIDEWRKRNPDGWFANKRGYDWFQQALVQLGNGEIENIMDAMNPSATAESRGGPLTRGSRRPRQRVGLPERGPIPPKDPRTLTYEDRVRAAYGPGAHRPPPGAGMSAQEVNAQRFALNLQNEQDALAAARDRLVLEGDEAKAQLQAGLSQGGADAANALHSAISSAISDGAQLISRVISNAFSSATVNVRTSPAGPSSTGAAIVTATHGMPVDGTPRR